MAKLHVRGCIETIFDRIASRFGVDTKKYLRLVKSASAESESDFNAAFSVRLTKRATALMRRRSNRSALCVTLPQTVPSSYPVSSGHRK